LLSRSIVLPGDDAKREFPAYRICVPPCSRQSRADDLQLRDQRCGDCEAGRIIDLREMFGDHLGRHRLSFARKPTLAYAEEGAGIPPGDRRIGMTIDRTLAAREIGHHMRHYRRRTTVTESCQRFA